MAAYAARSRMPCVIATLRSVPETMRAFMRIYGAEVHDFASSEDRYGLVADGVANHGWHACSNASSPPVGSTAYGVDAYKTIAYELWEQMDGRTISAVIVPTGYGDCITGLAQGFDDLAESKLISQRPKLIAAEVFEKISSALGSDSYNVGPRPAGPTAAFSIGGGYTTYQAIKAVRSSGGVAVSIPEAEIRYAQAELARREGIFVEASSAAAMVRHDVCTATASCSPMASSLSSRPLAASRIRFRLHISKQTTPSEGEPRERRR